jgi:predicted nucleotidyltransferase
MGRTEPVRIEVAAEEIVARLCPAFTVSAVILFGSRARGDHTQHSDLDIAVVSPDFAGEPRMYRRVARLQDALTGLHRIDAVGLAPQELEALDCLLVLDIVDEGLPIHDDGIFARARRLLEKKQKAGKVERVNGGWRISPDASA